MWNILYINWSGHLSIYLNFQTYLDFNCQQYTLYSFNSVVFEKNPCAKLWFYKMIRFDGKQNDACIQKREKNWYITQICHVDSLSLTSRSFLCLKILKYFCFPYIKYTRSTSSFNLNDLFFILSLTYSFLSLSFFIPPLCHTFIYTHYIH